MNASPPEQVGIIGVGLAAVGAIAYGIATVIGRNLAASGVDSATALGIRFAVAALILVVLLKVRGAPLRPQCGELLPIVLLGAIGYTWSRRCFTSRSDTAPRRRASCCSTPIRRSSPASNVSAVEHISRQQPSPR